MRLRRDNREFPSISSKVHVKMRKGARMACRPTLGAAPWGPRGSAVWAARVRGSDTLRGRRASARAESEREGRASAERARGRVRYGVQVNFHFGNWRKTSLQNALSSGRPQPAGARNTQSLRGKPSRVPKTAGVQDTNGLLSELHIILGMKIRVASLLLAEWAGPERVENARAAGAPLQTDAGRP